MAPSPSPPAPGNGNFPYRRLAIGLGVTAVLVIGIGWSVWPGLSWNSSESGPMVHTVARGEFIHEITDRGNVEGFETAEVKCEVKSKNLTGTQILYVIPEGTEITEKQAQETKEQAQETVQEKKTAACVVPLATAIASVSAAPASQPLVLASFAAQAAQEKTILVELDSSSLELDKINQEIALAKSKGEESQALAAFKAAESAVKEYLGKNLETKDLEKLEEEYLGNQPSPTVQLPVGSTAEIAGRMAKSHKDSDAGAGGQTRRAIVSEIAVAEENYNRAEKYLEYSLGLYGKGYVTKTQLDADRFAVKKAETDLEIARTKLDVFDRFTRDKQITQLVCDRRTAKAKLEAAEASRKLSEKLLEDINIQIAKCTIYAKNPGPVVYANVTGFRGTKDILIAAGEMARERQVLLRIPDPNKMQVIARISEAKIAMVAKGAEATIRLDAYPDVELEGEVDKIDAFPAPTGWMGSVVKEYETTVKFKGWPEGLKLKPGLTAEVRIRIERLPDVLQVPVQSVLEHGGTFYCVVPAGRDWKAREVQIGSSNDKFVVIREGLEEKEQVVLNAAAYRDKVQLPEVPAANGRPSGYGLSQRTRPRESDYERIAGKEPPAAKADPEQEAKRLFEQLDTNHDGLLTAGELAEPWRSRLRKADTDDGSVDLREFSAVMARAPWGTEGGGRKARATP